MFTICFLLGFLGASRQPASKLASKLDSGYVFKISRARQPKSPLSGRKCNDFRLSPDPPLDAMIGADRARQVLGARSRENHNKGLRGRGAADREDRT
jgi:hypothetical protein